MCSGFSTRSGSKQGKFISKQPEHSYNHCGPTIMWRGAKSLGMALLEWEESGLLLGERSIFWPSHPCHHTALKWSQGAHGGGETTVKGRPPPLFLGCPLAGSTAGYHPALLWLPKQWHSHLLPWPWETGISQNLARTTSQRCLMIGRLLYTSIKH